MTNMGASVSMRPFLITAAGQFEKQIQRPVAPYFLASALLPMAALSRSAVVPAFKMLRSAPTAAIHAAVRRVRNRKNVGCGP